MSKKTETITGDLLEGVSLSMRSLEIDVFSYNLHILVFRQKTW